MEHFITQWLPSLEHFHHLIYWLAFFAALTETALIVGLIVPGSTVLLLLGAYAAGGNLDFWVLWGFAVAGAVLGDNLNFFLGRRYGRYWSERGFWFLKPKHLRHAGGFFDAHGVKSVFLGRFIPSIKELIPFVAGTVQMRPRTFLLWNILGAMGWGLEWVGAGYLFAHSLNIVQLWLPRVGMLLLASLLLYLLLWILQRLAIRYGRSAAAFTLSVWRSIRDAVAQNKDVQILVRSHPRFFGFLRSRLDRTRFNGLTLTLLVLSFSYVLILFGGIVEDLLTSDPIVRVDQHIAQLVATFRSPEVTRLFSWITQLGNPGVALPIFLLVCIALFVLGELYLIIPLVAAMLGSLTFTLMGKQLFERPRPLDAVLLEHSYSFPSGHATLAMAFYGFITYLLIRLTASWKLKVHYFFTGTVVILLLGLSRIILDVHYLSDVWGGFLVGALWLIIGISITEWLVSAGHASFQKNTETKERRVAAGFVFAAFVYFIGFLSVYSPTFAPEPVRQAVQLKRPLIMELKERKLQYTRTLLGDRSLPIGLVLVAKSDAMLFQALERAGWRTAREFSFKDVLRSILQPDSLGNISISPSFWNGMINDYAFVLPSQGEVSLSANTLRIWKTPYRSGGAVIYLAVTRQYVGTLWRLFHAVGTDIDASKTQLIHTLKQAHQGWIICQRKFVKPMTGKFLLGGDYFTKGAITIIDLRREKPLGAGFFCGAMNPGDLNP